SLHVGILPGRSWCRRAIPDTQRMQTPPDNLPINSISIPHQISWRCIPWECLGDLLAYPLRCRMRRDGMVNQLPSTVCNNDQAIEKLETDRRHDEQICGGNARRLVAQEGRPALTRTSGAPGHVLCDSRLGDFDAELEQFAMDPGCTP